MRRARLGVAMALGLVGGGALLALSAPTAENTAATPTAALPTAEPPHVARSAPRSAPAPVPVLLVPGWFDTARDLAALRIRLLGVGWPGTHVATITFEDPTGSNRDHAVELAVAIDELRAETGAEQVDVVAHSMGGLATRWYLLGREDRPVRRVAFIGSPHRGTLSAHLSFGGGRREMMPGSPFLDTLNTEAPVPLGVDVITVRTRVDTHIVPGQSATLPGVPDYELCCPTHAGLLHHQEVFEVVLDFLERR